MACEINCVVNIIKKTLRVFDVINEWRRKLFLDYSAFLVDMHLPYQLPSPKTSHNLSFRTAIKIFDFNWWRNLFFFEKIQELLTYKSPLTQTPLAIK